MPIIQLSLVLAFLMCLRSVISANQLQITSSNFPLEYLQECLISCVQIKVGFGKLHKESFLI